MRVACPRWPANERPRAIMADKPRLVAVWKSIGCALIAFVAYQSLNHDPIDIPI